MEEEAEDINTAGSPQRLTALAVCTTILSTLKESRDLGG